jgi:hypothetical protein
MGTRKYGIADWGIYIIEEFTSSICGFTFPPQGCLFLDGVLMTTVIDGNKL